MPKELSDLVKNSDSNIRLQPLIEARQTLRTFFAGSKDCTNLSQKENVLQEVVNLYAYGTLPDTKVEPCLEYLVRHGANVNHQDADGWTTLMDVCFFMCCTNSDQPLLSIINMLVRNGADLTVRTHYSTMAFRSYASALDLYMHAKGSRQSITVQTALGAIPKCPPMPRLPL